jgi:hypothetical protein
MTVAEHGVEEVDGGLLMVKCEMETAEPGTTLAEYGDGESRWLIVDPRVRDGDGGHRNDFHRQHDGGI